MAVQFIRGNPAIDRFNAETARANSERRAENEEFRQRFQQEQAMGLDKALRTGIASFYATPKPAISPAPATASPAPAAAPTAPAARAVPPTPASAPDPSGLTMGNEKPLPNAGAILAAPGGAQPSAPAAPVSATPAPATTGPARTAAVAPTGSPHYAPLINELAKTSGTGQAMMGLFTHDQQEQRAAANQQRQMQDKGSELMLKSLADGDLRAARLVADQYKLAVPPEFWSNRDAVMNLRVAGSLAHKTFGLQGQEAVKFAQAYGAAKAKGVNDDAALLEGMKAVGTGFRAKGHFINDRDEVTFYDERGQTQPSGMKARPQKWQVSGGGAGGGGRGSATIQNREDMAKRIKVAYPGLDDMLVQRLVINPRAIITPQDVTRVRASMARQTDRLGRPIYTDQASLDAAVKSVLDGAKQMAGFAAQSNVEPGGGDPGPAPAPAPAPAAPGKGGTVRYRFNATTGNLDPVQ